MQPIDDVRGRLRTSGRRAFLEGAQDNKHDAASGGLTNSSHHPICDRTTRPLGNRLGEEVEPLHPPGEIGF